MNADFPPGYQLRIGTGKDRALLVKFMTLTYQELFPSQSSFNHLTDTVKKYFSVETPLWWVENLSQQPVACLWMGTAIDQASGKSYGYIFLLMVLKQYRRQGIGTRLIATAENWAKARGINRIGLQVFSHNQSALKLYHQLGFQTQSLSMIKYL
ncbi:GCN5-related N-acetyltransferase [Stanieria cyanosphaera PCC 7437]|uniref:GCN5-related N-acetyltransferase n=1 Tax=Stanieria cyanosphaera (strain ATCC 29371 / PCC 7437) TaxID=111780 RepID=K9XPE5_STAC7|nr:GNAT family N-acetyltransferase [Stanieria cyanosphaera]AFZ33964.1 GCN5-related N-acetyltransferase [Stanieria cyanosphaera PCC 7437]